MGLLPCADLVSPRCFGMVPECLTCIAVELKPQVGSSLTCSVHNSCALATMLEHVMVFVYNSVNFIAVHGERETWWQLYYSMLAGITLCVIGFCRH